MLYFAVDEAGNTITAVPVPTFTNTYDPQDASVSLDAAVSKELIGRELNANDAFVFAVFKDGEYSHTDTTGALLVGGCGLVGTAIYGKKRKRSEKD